MMRCPTQILLSIASFWAIIYVSFGTANEVVFENYFLPADDLGFENDQLVEIDMEYQASEQFLPTDDDSESLFPSIGNSASLLLFNEDPGSSTQMFQDLEDLLVFPEDYPTIYEDPAPIMAFDEVSSVDLPDLPTFSEKLETPPLEDELLSWDLDPLSLVDSDYCASDAEQTMTKARRRNNMCPVNTTPKPFPPPYANPGRRDMSPENEPKPRPASHVRNTKNDFEACPSGRDGYRMYAVCDSGQESDRIFTESRGWTLINVDPSMFPFFFKKKCFLFPWSFP
jgi:hypothetical protein